MPSADLAAYLAHSRTDLDYCLAKYPQAYVGYGGVRDVDVADGLSDLKWAFIVDECGLTEIRIEGIAGGTASHAHPGL